MFNLAKSSLLTGPRSEKPKTFLDFPAGGRDFSLPQYVKAGSGAPPSSYSVGIKNSLSGDGKAVA
jgi:hypothetical protein